MNLRPTGRVLGRMLLVLTLAELFPILCCLWYSEWHSALAFAATAAFTGLCGGALVFLGRGAGNEFFRREGILIVVGAWVLASLFGALPYVLSGQISHPVDALFEATSGFTTTGASILTDIEALDKGMLFWRSFTQWLGGMGIIVMFVALLPELGPGARFLYKLEVPGPTAETLHPRVHETAAALWRIYLLMSGLQVVLLLLAGLDLYHAMTTTFSTMSTAGFSPRADSVGAFDSHLVEGIVIVFMLAAGVNFSLYYGLRASRGRNFLRDPELRIYLGLILAASAVVCVSLVDAGLYDNLSEAMIDSLFQVTSITTTTGFVTADFDAWPNLARVILVILMFVGGCAGSTTGGMKVMRLVIGLKAAFREVRSIFSPNTIQSVFIGRKAVPDSVVRSVAGFLILYFALWAVGILLLTVGSPDLETAMSASIATLGNIGPGLSAIGPTESFAFFAPWQKIVMVVLMWFGRLEIYAIAAVVSVAFWRR